MQSPQEMQAKVPDSRASSVQQLVWSKAMLSQAALLQVAQLPDAA